MKAGLLAFGALIWAAPVVAQSQDPLAPLPVKSKNATLPNGTQPGIAVTPTQPGPPVVLPAQGSGAQSTSAAGPASTQTSVQSAPALQPAIAAPKDWRGVFDAINDAFAGPIAAAACSHRWQRPSCTPLKDRRS